eukprot:scaffold60410_cov17-Tisochrysis_lutea.AAC.1
MPARPPAAWAGSGTASNCRGKAADKTYVTRSGRTYKTTIHADVIAKGTSRIPALGLQTIVKWAIVTQERWPRPWNTIPITSTTGDDTLEKRSVELSTTPCRPNSQVSGHAILSMTTM